MCTADFLALLDHDDTLAPFALFEVAQRLNEDATLDFIYSDKDQLSEDGHTRMDPLFKPRWSPDLLWSANYLTHLCVLRTSLVREIEGWRSETDGAQDWDLFLRALEKSNRIAHIPKVLYHWRRVSTSVAARGNDAKPYAAEAQLRTLRFHLERQEWQAEPAFTSAGLIQLRWTSAEPPRISVIVPCEDDSNIEEFRERIPEPMRAQVELLVVPPAAAQLNKAVRGSSGDIVVFLDRRAGVGSETWLAELAGIVSQPGIGIAGCKLFSLATHLIRHAGICFNADGGIEHPFANESDYVYNSFGGANWYRDLLAVSGACFAIRREVFDGIGGFSETPAFPRLDVDLCLRVVLDAGLRVVYNPFARMWQDEEALLERALPGDGAAYIRATFPSGDPFFNPNLVSAARAPRDHNYAEEARALVQVFDSVPAEIEESIASCSRARGGDGHFVWFIPDFQNGFYGGIHTILRFADYFRSAHGIRSTFAVLGHAHPVAIKSRIARVSPDLAASSTVESIDSYAGLSRLEAGRGRHRNIMDHSVLRAALQQGSRKILFPAGSGIVILSSRNHQRVGRCHMAIRIQGDLQYRDAPRSLCGTRRAWGILFAVHRSGGVLSIECARLSGTLYAVLLCAAAPCAQLFRADLRSDPYFEAAHGRSGIDCDRRR